MRTKTKPEIGTEPPHIRGIADIAADYDAFILDLWGVVHNGLRPYDGVTDCLIRLIRMGRQVGLLSNSPGRSSQVSELLNTMGITRNMYTHLLTSGEMVNMLFGMDGSDLARLGASRYYDLWPQSHAATLDGLPLRKAGRIDEADFILAAYLDNDSRNELRLYEEDLARALTLKLPFICANPDRKVHHGEKLHLCPGEIAARYEELGGRVYWVGKPYTLVYKTLYEMMGGPDKSRIIAVGDSMDTDIKGASGFGIDSILNLAGLHRDDVSDVAIPGQPDRARIMNLLEGYEHRPSYTLSGFRWTGAD